MPFDTGLALALKDHQFVIGSDLKYKFTVKCQTNKTRMKRRPGAETSSAGEADAPECPVLWVKVDPDYAWAREIVMRQPMDAWVEQLKKDLETDAQVGCVAQWSTRVLLLT